MEKPVVKTFIDIETNTTADITLVDTPIDLEGELPPQVYWFNRLKSAKPGKGGGTKVLKQVTSFIDEVRVPLINQPSAYGQLSQYQLVDFYTKHGFVPTKAYGRKLLVYRPGIRPSAGRSGDAEPTDRQ